MKILPYLYDHRICEIGVSCDKAVFWIFDHPKQNNPQGAHPAHIAHGLHPMVAEQGLRPKEHDRQGQHLLALGRIFPQQQDADRHSGSHLFQTTRKEASHSEQPRRCDGHPEQHPDDSARHAVPTIRFRLMPP
ncbi:hypothetical protein PDENDC454_24068 [Paenibacillus dendritiformis C454]|uniref:Uncharacterized protein n=1 Tax=Paenibacillus dendritiformis C454 TaxID=1131935 RepID=H3SMM0_9BACL|nr:hypothetical protein PDENDC454_24068 [Paenibacillus dendritiformis C454]